ncbi:ATPase domain-containing protein [Halorubrum sp. HHNYT27]|uniref:ATPase domain-containing protein n=1 Tax=Halorubrum sp. HHNYT27 TaxID=3402275 RepID=UPI003EBE044A
MAGTVSTGDQVFDTALDGGIPTGASVLFTGGPGTGKTTAAMQFLQAGLEADEQCVFISTEQAIAELRIGLEDFGFEFDHPNLTLTTVHAGHGESVTTGEAGLVMRTLDGGTTMDEGRSVPFTPEYIQQYFERLAPADRIVLDSASGFAAVTQDHAQYRRVMIDIIRQFKRQFEATSILTAQDYAQQDDTATNHGTLSSSLALQFTVDGVVRLWQDELEGEYHRYVHITKMRGADHDLRPYEMNLSAKGMRLKPLNRSPPASLSSKGRTTSGLPELDNLLGGGFITGSTISYLYSGDAHADLLLSKVTAEMVNSDRDVVIVPPPNLTYEQLDQYLQALEDQPLKAYLDAESIRVLDVLGSGSKSNNFLPDDITSRSVESPKQDELLDELRRIQYQSTTPLTMILSCQATRMFGDDNVLPGMISVLTAEARGSDDTVMFAGTPELIDERTAARLMNASEQILKHERRPNGMESIRLRKGLGGEVGSSRVVEYYRDAPYLSLS